MLCERWRTSADDQQLRPELRPEQHTQQAHGIGHLPEGKGAQGPGVIAIASWMRRPRSARRYLGEDVQDLRAGTQGLGVVSLAVLRSSGGRLHPVFGQRSPVEEDKSLMSGLTGYTEGLSHLPPVHSSSARRFHASRKELCGPARLSSGHGHGEDVLS